MALIKHQVLIDLDSTYAEALERAYRDMTVAEHREGADVPRGLARAFSPLSGVPARTSSGSTSRQTPSERPMISFMISVVPP